MDIFSKKIIYTVTRLNGIVSNLLTENLGTVLVTGEVSNLTVHTSGHIYLSLKDSNSQIRAVVFKSTAQFLKFKIKNGMTLLVRGKISVYEPRGDYQLIID